MNTAVQDGGNIVKLETHTASLTIPQLIQQAVLNGNTDIVRTLLDAQEQWEANERKKQEWEAKKRFYRAMGAAKAELPIMTKTKTNRIEGQTKDYKYEDLADVVKIAAPLLAKHGLYVTYRFDDTNPDRVTVYGMLTHVDGYREETSLSAAPDLSGGKNTIQAKQSAITYLQRSLLKGILGLAAAVDDDGQAHGNAAPPQFITQKQAIELETLIKSSGGDVTKFCAWAKVETLDHITVDKFDVAKQSISDTAARRQAASKKERN